MFFLLKLSLECRQTRRDLHRTSNRMRDAFRQWAKHTQSIFMPWRETGYQTEEFELTHTPARKRTVLPHRYLYSLLAPSLLLPPQAPTPWKQLQAEDLLAACCRSPGLPTEAGQVWLPPLPLWNLPHRQKKTQTSNTITFFFFYSLSSFMFVQNTLIGMKGKIMAFFKTQPVQSIIHETRPLFLRGKKSIQKWIWYEG